MIIAVDFDGTCVEHRYPAVGQDVPYAVDCLKWLVGRGDQLILWTMRSEKHLQDAVDWFKSHDIPLWGVNENPDQDWTSSPKAYARVYIDDAALGCPMLKGEYGERTMVDWQTVWAMMMGGTLVQEIEK